MFVPFYFRLVVCTFCDIKVHQGNRTCSSLCAHHTKLNSSSHISYILVTSSHVYQQCSPFQYHSTGQFPLLRTMPQVQCPVRGCTYKTDDLPSDIVIKLLDIHASSHASPYQPTSEAKRVQRPLISSAGTSEEWQLFS